MRRRGRRRQDARPGTALEITDVLVVLLRGEDHVITQAAGQNLVTIPLQV
jgi:hypothetical protein